MTLSVIPIYLFFFTILLIIAEGFIPARNNFNKIGRQIKHIQFFIVNTIITRLSVWFLLIALVGFCTQNKWGIANWLFQENPAISFIASIIVMDVYNYFWHRLSHKVGFLWRFHRFHHWDTQMDWSTALRFQPGELVLSAFTKSIMIIAWGPSLHSFLIFEGLITGFSLFHHANLKVSHNLEAILNKIIMTPLLHAGHHTVTLRTRNANFSTILIFWDRIFGSYCVPTQEEIKKLGTRMGRKSFLSWKAYALSPFREYE